MCFAIKGKDAKEKTRSDALSRHIEQILVLWSFRLTATAMCDGPIHRSLNVGICLVEVDQQGGEIARAVPDMQHVHRLATVAVEDQVIAEAVDRPHANMRKPRIG